MKIMSPSLRDQEGVLESKPVYSPSGHLEVEKPDGRS